jgi:hypothetical protein
MFANFLFRVHHRIVKKISLGIYTTGSPFFKCSTPVLLRMAQIIHQADLV